MALFGKRNTATIGSRTYVLTSSTSLDEEEFGFALQRGTVLPIEVVSDNLYRDRGTVHTMHCSREAIVTGLNMKNRNALKTIKKDQR